MSNKEEIKKEEKKEDKNEKEEEEVQDLEVLKTQLDTSVGIARSLISSWLPDIESDNEDNNTNIVGRPPRLGLGAKFLSQNQAEKINQGIFEKKYKEKLIKGNKRHLSQEEQLKKENEERAKKKKKEMDSIYQEDSKFANLNMSKAKTKINNNDNKSKAKNQNDILSMYLSKSKKPKRKNVPKTIV
ncbi:hypothetical protein BCR32DRAFT_265730 [Anaeromyces robustus]|uniref:Uncharacterized protein n=1 Tax=Anaeromyces robustus TaxID=1754192 RepID=A0A1Y1XIZ4_9FUNG|nr:hypothetical protein BCR32DRAFT_265730 [Anaeromyces robustus]|eukprot:ORX85334.1 hypothetical protein BCR32DRAFT_265730 [Anaeromyces robustus]